MVAAGGAGVALREQPLAVKLELLYRKELFPTALALLKAQPHGLTLTLALTLTPTLTLTSRSCRLTLTLTLTRRRPNQAQP